MVIKEQWTGKIPISPCEREGEGHLFYEEKTPWGKSAARFGILEKKRERERESSFFLFSICNE